MGVYGWLLGGMSGGCVLVFVIVGVLGSDVVLVWLIIVVLSSVVFELLRNC